MILLRGLCVLRSCSMSLVFYFYIYLSIYLSIAALPRERRRRRCFPNGRECRAGRTFDQQSGMKRCWPEQNNQSKTRGERERERTRDIENVKRAPRIYGGGVVGRIKFNTKPRAHHQQDNPHTHKPQTPPPSRLPTTMYIIFISGSYFLTFVSHFVIVSRRLPLTFPAYKLTVVYATCDSVWLSFSSINYACCCCRVLLYRTWAAGPTSARSLNDCYGNNSPIFFFF